MPVAPGRVASEDDGVAIRPMREEDLPAADHVCRLAFGTFLGMPDPTRCFGDADYIRTRWLPEPSAVFVADAGHTLLGSNFAANWGSIGLFGPLTVHPDYWNRGIATRLMEPILESFASWGVSHTGLFTFGHSPRHLHLYQKFGFWPRYVTMILQMPVAVSPARGVHCVRYSGMPEESRSGCLGACSELTGSIYDGLDLRREIQAVRDQRLGDTLLLWDNSRLTAIAVCHCGPGTEAGGDTCYIKFGAVRSGTEAAERLDLLLDACNELAFERGMSRLVAGVNTARHHVYARLLARGFRGEFSGVAMQRPNEPGYNRPDAWVIDDWR